MNIFIRPDNTIGAIFSYNKHDNKFLLSELCIFLILLFIGEFKELCDNELMDIKTCLSYEHTNFPFIVKLIVDNIMVVSDSEGFKKCSTLLEINSSKIDINKFDKIVHLQNISLNIYLKTSYQN